MERGKNAGSDGEDAINIGISGAGIVAVFLGSPAALAIGIAQEERIPQCTLHLVIYGT
ncbi:hypothetical protein GCM10027396_08320 [Insolitispirillum peregrinum]